MDARLRQLERQAATDPEAGLKLVHELGRLIKDQWQAVPCRGQYPHTYCKLCDGKAFVRINVTELSEYTPSEPGEIPQNFAANTEVNPSGGHHHSSNYSFSPGSHYGSSHTLIQGYNNSPYGS